MKKQTQTANAVVELKDQVNSMNNELTKLLDKLKELEVSGCGCGVRWRGGMNYTLLPFLNSPLLLRR